MNKMNEQPPEITAAGIRSAEMRQVAQWHAAGNTLDIKMYELLFSIEGLLKQIVSHLDKK